MTGRSPTAAEYMPSTRFEEHRTLHRAEIPEEPLLTAGERVVSL